MKRPNSKIFVLTILIIFSQTKILFTQNNAGCNGSRFIDKIFTFADIKSTDVKYGANFNNGILEDLRMTVYEPKDDTLSERPAVILAAGTTFTGGGDVRFFMTELAREYANRGYVAVSIHYRQLPDGTTLNASNIQGALADAMHDMKAAVRFLKFDRKTENIFKLDTNFIFVGGFSSGAMAALHLAYFGEEDNNSSFYGIVMAKGGLEGQSNDITESSSKVRGVINHAGGILDLDFIQPEEPWILSFHGTADNSISINTAQAITPTGYNTGLILHGSNVIHQKATELDIENLLISSEGGGHAIYSGNDKEGDFMKAFTFLEKELCDNTVGNAPIIQADSDNLILFPNPANDRIYLRYNGNKTIKLQLYDRMGNFKKNFEINRSKSSISLLDLPDGMYFYYISDFHASEHQSGKIIVQH